MFFSGLSYHHSSLLYFSPITLMLILLYSLFHLKWLRHRVTYESMVCILIFRVSSNCSVAESTNPPMNGDAVSSLTLTLYSCRQSRAGVLSNLLSSPDESPFETSTLSMALSLLSLVPKRRMIHWQSTHLQMYFSGRPKRLHPFL